LRIVEKKMPELGYQRVGRRLWSKGKKTVRVVTSSERHKGYLRILWREEWKDYDTIIYDYSSGVGSVCIVPVKVLFNSPFATQKRKESAYTNSGNWWSQRFPVNHEFRKLVLSYKNRWDLL
jgi:hypothetical protein